MYSGCSPSGWRWGETDFSLSISYPIHKGNFFYNSEVIVCHVICEYFVRLKQSQFNS